MRVVAVFAFNLFLHSRKSFQHKLHAWYMICQRGSEGENPLISWWTYWLCLVPVGYRCPHANCQVHEHTWGKLQKHMAKHPGKRVVVIIQNGQIKCLRLFLTLWKCVVAVFTCQVCKKAFGKADTLRRHKRIHSSHKPVLVCPREDCQAYFSTTFNLQHHIRKVHLELFKYRCSFPDCPRMFAMRVRNMSINASPCVYISNQNCFSLHPKTHFNSLVNAILISNSNIPIDSFTSKKSGKLLPNL